MDWRLVFEIAEGYNGHSQQNLMRPAKISGKGFILTAPPAGLLAQDRSNRVQNLFQARRELSHQWQGIASCVNSVDCTKWGLMNSRTTSPPANDFKDAAFVPSQIGCFSEGKRGTPPIWGENEPGHVVFGRITPDNFIAVRIDFPDLAVMQVAGIMTKRWRQKEYCIVQHSRIVLPTHVVILVFPNDFVASWININNRQRSV